MKKIVSSLALVLCFAIGFVATFGVYKVAYSANAGDMDAGIAPGPSVEITAGDPPVVVAVVPSDAISDPIREPAAAFDDVNAARKTGWTMVLLVALIMALRGLGHLKGLSFFKRDRVAIVVAGALTVATSLFDTLVLGGTWVAALYAAAGALAIYWRSKNAVVAPAAAGQ